MIFTCTFSDSLYYTPSLNNSNRDFNGGWISNLNIYYLSIIFFNFIFLFSPIVLVWIEKINILKFIKNVLLCIVFATPFWCLEMLFNIVFCVCIFLQMKLIFKCKACMRTHLEQRLTSKGTWDGTWNRTIHTVHVNPMPKQSC